MTQVSPQLPGQRSKQEVAKELMRILHPYKEKVEREIQSLMENFGEKTALRDACEYALLTPGKRFRPAIVLMVAGALGANPDVLKAALAVEFFHTASLIADDLPCMDNDDMRRGRKTVHKEFDEAIALLASFALIASGFEHIADGSEQLKQIPQLAAGADEICRIATKEAGRVNGIMGLIGGQYLDLYPTEVTEQLLLEIIEKKTVVLFELSFILGWLFGGGERAQLAEVKKAAYHFGCAYQIYDDIDDYEQDMKAQKKVNYAVIFGIEKAKEAVSTHVRLFRENLALLDLHSKPLEQLGDILGKLVSAN